MTHAASFALAFTLIVGGTGLAGCSKTETKTSGGGGGAAAAGPAGGPSFAAWDLPGKAKAWQGSWLVKENGSVQAWTITGDKVETWDGKEAKTFTLKVTAPCAAEFVSANGMAFPYKFTVVDGKLQKREAAGYRKGAEVLFCDGAGDFYTVDAAGACTLWKAEGFGSKATLVKSPGTCGIKPGAKGGEVFFHEGTNAGEFEIRGDAILARTSFETEAVAGDHAAAKAARDAK